MNCKILKNKISYASEVQNLGDFLIGDKFFFGIFIKAMNIQKSNILGFIEKRYVTAKVIEKSKFDTFKKLWDDFHNDVKTNQSKQGDLLEYIITQVKKPLKLVFQKLDYESSCIVYDSNKNVNINFTNCDLDVVLYNLEKVEVDDFFVHFDDNVEFLECKQDVNAFLRLENDGKAQTHTLKKLEMFKSVKSVVGQSDVKYIFPSFVRPGRTHMNYLKHNGYGFIEVVDGNQLSAILFS